jgi:hypothetical protein
MPGLWVIAGYILIPMAFGFVPGLLPRRVPLAVRWCLWLVLLAACAAYAQALRSAPLPFPWLVLVPFWLSSLLSLLVLVAETRRERRARGRAVRPNG